MGCLCGAVNYSVVDEVEELWPLCHARIKISLECLLILPL